MLSIPLIKTDLFVTAGRDGSIFVFDTRCSTQIRPDTGTEKKAQTCFRSHSALEYAVHSPVNTIRNAHVTAADVQKPLTTQKRRNDLAMRQVRALC